MSEQQPTSWRDRFFGGARDSDAAPVVEERPADAVQTGGASVSAPTESASTDSGQAEPATESAHATSATAEQQAAPEEAHQAPTETGGASVAASSTADDHARGTSVLGDSESGRSSDDVDTAVLDAQDASDDRSGDSPIEPRVIAPSALRGPSHSAAHPDDAARRTADEVQGEATERAQQDEQHAPRPADEQHEPQSSEAGPPELVEPRRPAFGLRRRADADTDAAAGEADEESDRTAEFAPVSAAAASAYGTESRGTEREFIEPEPTQALDTHEQPTRAVETQPASDTDAQTRVLDAQADDDEALRTERFGIIRDEVPASSIPVDDETARAAAGGGTPIVLVEEPMPPRRKGARGVGFAVALLATLIFAIVFAAGFFAVGYLFDRGFDALGTLETVWLRPSFLLPVIVFFLAYWIITAIVNRAGWWAHVLGGFVVALLVYAAHIGGAFMEEQGGWAAYTAVPGIGAEALGQLLLAPLSVLAFVIAREVPIWVGGIVARRGRKAREWNRKAMDDFNAENAERLAAYERARG